MRVLILSATTGGGHMTAANGLKDYIKTVNPDAEILISDTIQYISPVLNKAVTGGYLYLATKTPNLFGSLYRTADKENAINKAMGVTTSTISSRLKPLLEDFHPDIIVTTHPFATEIISAVKLRREWNIPVISIVTDFAIHQAYINEGVDAYIVSSDEMVGQMVERGVDKEKIYPFGIPVKPAFFHNDINRREALLEEGLDPDLPTILIMAGSFGVTDVLKIYHKIVNSSEDFQIIVVTGKNEKLYETFYRYLSKITLNNTLLEVEQSSRPKSITRLSRHKKPSKPTKLLYFTTEIPKYMHIADMIVTKPGGLTVSESVASGLPMGIFKAIPGQEEQNADFLVRHKMAVRLEKNNSCTAIINDLLSHPEKLQEMRDAIHTFSHGNSSEQIYLLMQTLLREYDNEECIHRKEEPVLTDETYTQSKQQKKKTKE